MKPIADEGALNELAEAAIGRVLAAERQARDAVEQARLEVNQLAESARLDARSVAERCERRIRRVADAFAQALALQLADIDAGAARLGQLPPLTAAEQAALQGAVEALARELIGAPR